MFPLHPGHPGHESALIAALAVVVVAAAFALTREGWSRAGALLGVGLMAIVLRGAVELLGIHVHGALHLLGHGLELSAVALLALAGYYALFDARTSPTANH